MIASRQKTVNDCLAGVIQMSRYFECKPGYGFALEFYKISWKKQKMVIACPAALPRISDAPSDYADSMVLITQGH